MWAEATPSGARGQQRGRQELYPLSTRRLRAAIPHLAMSQRAGVSHDTYSAYMYLPRHCKREASVVGVPSPYLLTSPCFDAVCLLAGVVGWGASTASTAGRARLRLL